MLRRVPWLASHCRSRSTCGVPRACRTPRISARGDGAEPRCHGAWPRSARVSDRPFALRPGPGSPHRLLPRPSCCVRLEERETRPRRSTSAGDSRGSGGRSRRLPVAPAPATASGAAADRVPCSRSGALWFRFALVAVAGAVTWRIRSSRVEACRVSKHACHSAHIRARISRHAYRSTHTIARILRHAYQTTHVTARVAQHVGSCLLAGSLQARACGLVFAGSLQGPVCRLPVPVR